jgi:hypothetical protein
VSSSSAPRAASAVGAAGPPRLGALSAGRPAIEEPAPPLWRWWTWALVGAAVIGAAVAIVLGTGMTPSFDAYGWLIWGHQLLYGNMNLNSAPSWKPMMIVFSLPMSLFGGATPPRLLSIAMVSGTLAMAPFAGRIAYRLACGRAEEIPAGRVRAAAWIGALFAAVGVLGMQGYGLPAHLSPPQSLWRLTFIADSDPLCAAIVLAAVDAHVSRRPRLAYVLLFAAGLNRPEAWPLMFLYGVYLIWRVPGSRLLVVGSWLLTLVAWYLPTAVAAKSIFQASKLDMGKAVAIKGEPVLPVLRRWLTFYEWPMQAAALLGIAIGLVRRDRRLLLLTGATALWLLVEMAFAYHGFSAVARYMIEPAALMIVVAGYGIARALAGPGERAAPGWRWTAGVLGPVLVVGLIVGVGYFLHLREARVRDMVPAVRNFGVVKRHLAQAIAKAGGPKAIRACGPPAALNGFQTQLAWSMGVNGDQVMFNPRWLKSHHTRMVLFTQTGLNGWVLRAYNVPRPLAARCARTVSVSVPSS